jgi:hypothetical protein
MRDSSAAPFAHYAVLSASIVAVTAWVPGTPFYADEGAGSAEGAIVVTALVLAGLLTRARLSWYVAAALDGVGLAVFASVFLLELANGMDALKPLALTLLAALQIAVLFSRDFDDWLRRRAVAPA